MDDQKQGGEELHHKPEKPKSELARREEEVLAFWEREHIFEKSLKKKSPKGEYVFYDGPPFANGLPHYGHMLQSALKDAVPRYRTMRGYRVKRQWGWDCHGLPVENLVEKELGFKTKRDIEVYGIEKFNAAARTSIMKDVADWKRIIPRIGRWADMENDYKTMDANYTESVWWAFKNLFDRNLVYEGFKAMHLCPRCGTTLSNFEVGQGYQDIEDIAVTIKLPLVDEPETSLLVWTTTSWTLPGNTAAAVNKDAAYVKARTDDGFVVVAKDRAEAVLGPNPKIYGEIAGKDLVGKSYLPPFSYFKDLVHKHKTHAWKIYAAPYVSLTDGTGAVHLAPAYGAEDMELANKEKIPLIHHVTDDGRFVATVTDFAHLPVKPKGRHKETDERIVEYLEQQGRLFKKELITHSYPHCWRCDTPLLNWAANSWFVSVQKVKSKLVRQNKKVRWVPEHVGSGRFNNLLQSAPDWAISRSRYWGAPIPVWRHSKSKEVKAIGSVDELLSLVRRSGNRYFLMRHGQAQSNVSEVLETRGDPNNHLTEEGKSAVRESATALKRQGKIDLIIVSPMVRTKETASIVQKTLGLPDGAVMVDERLREINVGALDGKSLAQWFSFFSSRSERFHKAPEGGETYADVRARVGTFLFDVEQRYTGKNILIVTHEACAWLMACVAARKSTEEIIADDDGVTFLPTANWREIKFTPFPHNKDFELDLHRPYIDEVPLGDALNGEWKRVPEVFDCWFESGSVPFASNHYPFEKKAFNPKRMGGFLPKGYPTSFIAEGVDQTRGWFYSLIVLGVALFGKTPYTAVVTNGQLLAEDGQKMSKRLRNYPDPLEVAGRFGADSLRYYLLSSSVMRGEDVRFKAQGVEEISKKLLMRLDNVRSFYELYQKPEIQSADVTTSHVLDRWIRSRLGELVAETTAGFESYELDVATRPLASFIDDLSTWYLRRSRDRFKIDGPDKAGALATLGHVLETIARVMAPVMPFFAEDLYQHLRSERDEESVHLTSWPEPIAVDKKLLTDMTAVRECAAEGLKLREAANIKIRQPLASFTATTPLSAELAAILKEELNVKEIKVGTSAVLDTELTPELKEEGMLRDMVRRIQEWRKEEKLQMSDRPDYTLSVNDEEKRVAEKYKAQLIEQTGLGSLRIE